MVVVKTMASPEEKGAVRPSRRAERAFPPARAPETGGQARDRTSPRGLEHFIAGRTLASSDSPAWADLLVKVYSRQSHQEPFLVPAVPEPLVVWIVSGEAIIEERELGGDWVACHVRVGDFFLTRTPSPYEMRWRAIGADPFQVMHLYLSIPLFERVGREMLGHPVPPVLRDVSGGTDPELSHLLALVRRELGRDSAGSELFVHGIAQAIAVHLIRHYASQGTADERQAALPRFKLRRALAHLEAQLAEPFDLTRLADAVGMSRFHFSRQFKRATGLSPSRYFIRERIARAQQLLQETDASIIEIGMAVGYSSPGHFAQVFRRETGVSPSQYRQG